MHLFTLHNLQAGLVSRVGGLALLNLCAEPLPDALRNGGAVDLGGRHADCGAREVSGCFHRRRPSIKYMVGCAQAMIIIPRRGSCSLRKATGWKQSASAHRVQTHAATGDFGDFFPSLAVECSHIHSYRESMARRMQSMQPENYLSPPTPNCPTRTCHYVLPGMQLLQRTTRQGKVLHTTG